MAAAALIDKHCPADPGIDATRDNGFELPLVVVQFVYGVLCDFFFLLFFILEGIISLLLLLKHF